VTARREPLLWLQLLSIGLIPLELLLLRLVLAGADLGPVPAIERLLTWGVAVLAPTLALWQRPADWGSLLLLQRPLRGRNQQQRQLSGLQKEVVPRASLLIGSVALLVILWWIDQSAVLVIDMSPLKGSSRLITLLTSIPILALLTWQWHQLSQTIWLLSQSDDALSQATALSEDELRIERLCLGLSLLSIPELEIQQPISASNGTATIEPKQGTEKEQRAELDADIGERDSSTPSSSHPHGEQADATGSEQSEPENPTESTPGAE
jgi:hypothetical protein